MACSTSSRQVPVSFACSSCIPQFLKAGALEAARSHRCGRIGIKRVYAVTRATSKLFENDLQRKSPSTTIERYSLRHALSRLCWLRRLSPGNSGADKFPDYSELHMLAATLAQHRGYARQCYEAALVFEANGVPLRRRTAAVVLNALCKEHLFFEVESLLKRLWSRSLRVGTVHTKVRDRESSSKQMLEVQISDAQWKSRVPNAKLIVCSADAAVRAGRVDIAARLIGEMERNGVSPNVFTYSVLIKGYGRQKRLEKVKRTLASIENRGIQPDIALLNSVVDAFVRCDALDVAMQFVATEFQRHNIKPNERSFNPILRELARKGDVSRALVVRSTMVSVGIEPDSTSLNALIQASINAKDFDGARRLLRTAVPWTGETENNMETPSAAAAWASFKHTQELTDDQCVAYTIVVSGLADHGNFLDSSQLLRQMSSLYAMHPSTRVERQVAIAATSAITAFFRRNRVQDAMQLFGSIQSECNVRPVPDTYLAVIRGLCEQSVREFVDTASAILEDLIEYFLQPKSALEESFMTSKDLDNSCSSYSTFLKDITMAEVKKAINTVLDGFVRLDDMQSAEHLFVSVRRRGIQVDHFGYTALITGYGRAGDLVAVKRKFSEMQDDGVLLDRVALNSLLGIYVRCNNKKLANAIFDEMRRNGDHLAPDCVTYSEMITLYIKDDDIESAWKSYEQLKDSGLTPSEDILQRMMTACVSPTIRSSPWYRDTTTSHEDGVPGKDLRPSQLSMTSIHSALAESARSKNTEMTDNVRRVFSDGSNSKHWSSSRIRVLLNDMVKANIPRKVRERWQSTVGAVWS